MALSREKYLVFQPDEFYKRFPHLNGGNHKPTSKATPDEFKPKKPYYIYNCFAFVVNDKKKFWWPEPYSYWPRDNATESVEEIMSVLAEYFKYEPCNDRNFGRGVQKIAIFVKDGIPVHIAIQHHREVVHGLVKWDTTSIWSTIFIPLKRGMGMIRKFRGMALL